MAALLDEAGNDLLSEALGQLCDEAGPQSDEEGTAMTSPTAFAAVQLSETPVSTPTPSAVDAVNGNITPNTGKTIFRLKNSDTAAHTVTFKSIVTADSDQLQMPGLPVTVPASGDVQVTNFDPDVYGAQMTWLASDGTHITVSVTEPA